MPVIAPLSSYWRESLQALEFAFQPIVNTHTGVCAGYEALLRGTERLGCKSIEEFFDRAHLNRALGGVEVALRAKAAAAFRAIPGHSTRRLFLNLDNRALNQDIADLSATAIADQGVDPAAVCIEISERHEIGIDSKSQSHLEKVRRNHRMKIAIDDFGRGFAGLQLLYNLEPDFIKIDRFFISNIADDRKRRIFVANIVNIAHLLGTAVIAEGVETESEYIICREVGCDLVQGFVVARPTTEYSSLRDRYDIVGEFAGRERRRRGRDLHIIFERIERPVPVPLDSNIFDVFHRFRSEPDSSFIPVVDSLGEPVGIIREQDMKETVYSPYGRDLLSNRSYRRELRDFVTKCPVADLHMKAERIIEIFAKDLGSEGILLVEDMRYVGFLSPKSLLSIISEKNLALARDQNPLTLLPGNTLIYEFVSQALGDRNTGFAFAYVDFDNFKPFNDHFGFRLGDRAINTMAELLRKLPPSEDRFVGHIGGDDFFIGWRNCNPEPTRQELARLLRDFAGDVAALYDPATRREGFIMQVDRQGQLRRFPLLTASAVLLELPCCAERGSVEHVAELIAHGKHQAKISSDGIHMMRLEAGSGPLFAPLAQSSLSLQAAIC